MNVDRIKFVNDDNYITIYTMEDYWQYLYHVHSIPGNTKNIYLVECHMDRISQATHTMTNMIEIFLNKPHKLNVVEMVEYMKR